MSAYVRIRTPKIKLNVQTLVVPDNKVRTLITSLLLKQDLSNLPNLQEYLKTEKKAIGKVFKD